MADGYALALQKGLVAALKADAGVTAIVGNRVYDEPPQSAIRPYIRIGAIVPQALRTQCKRAANVAFSIQCHSRPLSGRVEATGLSDAVVAALDEQEDAVTVAGFDLVKLHWMTTDTDRDEDGQSYLSIAVFDALLDG